MRLYVDHAVICTDHYSQDDLISLLAELKAAAIQVEQELFPSKESREYHPFVATSNGNCSSCGHTRHHSIHRSGISRK